mgnify:FL=1
MGGERRLEAELAAMAAVVDWPDPSPGFPEKVAARIGSEAAAPVRVRWRRPAIAFAGLLVVTMLLMFSPAARQAVADVLGAAGIRVGFLEQAPTAGAELDLGEQVALAEIEGVIDFEVRVPGGDLGTPDEVFVGSGDQVSMVWNDSPTLPAAGDTGIGVLFTQSPSTGELDLGVKGIGEGTNVVGVIVEGVPGLWVEGAAHTLTLYDADGAPIEETTRLAANVLLWEASGVYHRLETTGGLQSALDVVDQLQPLR